MPLKMGGHPTQQLLHPTHRITDPPCLPPTPTSLPRRGQSGPNFPAPSVSPFPKAEVPLPFPQQVRVGALPGSAWIAATLESKEEGARRHNTAPPQAPASRPAQALRQGAKGGGGAAKGRPGSRRRPQHLGSAKMARVSAGSRRRRRRRLGGTGPGLGRLAS